MLISGSNGTIYHMNTDRITAFNLKKASLFSLLFFFLLLIGIFAIFFTSALRDNLIRKNDIIKSETILNETDKTGIFNRINRITSDLLYIRDTVRIAGLSESGKEAVKKQWIAYADNIKLFDQICFIDTNGNEILRVNYSDNGSYAVPQNELQNTAKRVFFKNSIGLRPDQIYISRLDLNMEHYKIESPKKPVIRFILPYTDAAGKKYGEISVTYLADDMLGTLEKISRTSTGSTYLLNSDGYWLFNSTDKSKEWAFMYAHKKRESFAKIYPEEWKKITATPSGNFTTKNGLFIYSTILTKTGYKLKNEKYSIVLEEGDWNLVTHITPTQNRLLFSSGISIIAKGIIRRTAPFFIILWALSFIAAFLYQKKQQRNRRIRYLAEYDEMTGIFNRRTIYEKLSQFCRDENRIPFAVAFIDIDGLKSVNDTFGHESGDILITEIVRIIKKCIRSNDLIARLGGDEFLVIFPNADSDTAETVWQRATAAFAAVNAEKKYQFSISASHGISEYREGDSEASLIERADNLMYKEKKASKKERR